MLFFSSHLLLDELVKTEMVLKLILLLSAALIRVLGHCKGCFLVVCYFPLVRRLDSSASLLVTFLPTSPSQATVNWMLPVMSFIWEEDGDFIIEKESFG